MLLLDLPDAILSHMLGMLSSRHLSRAVLACTDLRERASSAAMARAMKLPLSGLSTHECDRLFGGQRVTLGLAFLEQLADRAQPRCTTVAGTSHCLCISWHRPDTFLAWGGDMDDSEEHTISHLGHGVASGPAVTRPVVVPFHRAIFEVSAGDCYSTLLTLGGEVYSWGSNLVGRLGQGLADERLCLASSGSTPARVALPERALQISCGSFHALALLASGAVCAWGEGINTGQPAEAREDFDAATSPNAMAALAHAAAPLAVGTLPPCKAVSAGHFHSLAVSTAGALYAWGENDCGRCGVGARHLRRSEPILQPLRVRLGGEKGTERPTAGPEHHLDSGPPVDMRRGEVPARLAAAGGSHSLVMCAELGLWAFGANRFGQLGPLVEPALQDADEVHEPARVDLKFVRATAGDCLSAVLSFGGRLCTLGDEARSGRRGDPSGAVVGEWGPVEAISDVEEASRQAEAAGLAGARLVVARAGAPAGRSWLQAAHEPRARPAVGSGARPLCRRTGRHSLPRQVSVGDLHVIARCARGVYTWGGNGVSGEYPGWRCDEGQLGHGPELTHVRLPKLVEHAELQNRG